METVLLTITEQPADIVAITVQEIMSDKGADGITPQKGIDYFDGVTPQKGVDYFDGYTPQKGIDYFDGVSPQAETQSSLINKIGYATDQTAGLLSPQDHLLFRNKQPAGQYVTAEAGKSLMTQAEHDQLATLWQIHLNS